jgi:hypothetical protein
MIDVNEGQIVSTLTNLTNELTNSLARMRRYQNEADSQEGKKRWSSEATHREAEILICSDLIASVRDGSAR